MHSGAKHGLEGDWAAALTGDGPLSLQRLEERFRLATDAAVIGVWDIDLRTGHLAWDRNMHKLYEIDPSNFNNQFEDWATCLHPGDIESSTAKFQKAAEDISPFDDEFRIVLGDGRIKHIRARAQVFADGAGAPTRAVGVNYDVSEQKAALGSVAEAAEKADILRARLDRLTSNVPAGLFEYREGPEGDISFPFFNNKLPDLLGIPKEEIIADGAECFRHIHPEDMEYVVVEIAESKENLTPFNTRYRYHHPIHGLRWYKASTLPTREADGGTVWYGSMQDVTTDVAREARLREAHEVTEKMRAENERQALHDALTGLPNRRYYDQKLGELMLKAGFESEQGCTLIRIDLDHFKYVNDTLGHEAGDSVLKRVADVLELTIGFDHFAARIGGDEFSILMMPGASLDDAQALITTIRSELKAPHYHDGRQCRFGASFGIAHSSQLSVIGQDIQMFADAALYKAKSAGRNRVEVFTSEMHEKILSDRQLAVEIQDGLERDEFVPYFQPQVTAKDGRLAGVEVLLRWNHPVRGVLAPGAFMHVAEHLRLVPDLDRVMMEKCQSRLLKWASEGLIVPRMSFNVSAGRLEDASMLESARLLASGPTAISFELLESILIEDEHDILRLNIDKIREFGIDIEIDDFGSGHASIVSLMQVQPSALKIDRRLIIPIDRSRRSQDLVRAIIQMSQSLGIQTIAEGVETPHQAAVLREMGCDLFQGFYYGKPMRGDAFFTLAKTTLANAA